MKLGDPTHGLNGTALERVRLAGDGLRDLRAFWDESARVDAIRAIADSTDEGTFETSGATEAADLLTLAPPQPVILEIGCGIGRIMQHLAPSCSELHGVDISAEMVERGSRRLAHQPHVKFHQGNGYDLGMFRDGKFDLVYSTIVFQHVPKTVAFNYMIESCRVLKPNGVFRLQIPNLMRDDHFNAFRHFSQPYFAENPYPMNFYTTPEIVRMLTAAGLTIDVMTDDIVVVAARRGSPQMDLGQVADTLMDVAELAPLRELIDRQNREIAELRRVCDHWSVRALRQVRAATRRMRRVRRPGSAAA